MELEGVKLSAGQQKLADRVERSLKESFPDHPFMRDLCRQLGFVWSLQELINSVVKVETRRSGLGKPFTDAIKDLSEGMKMEACTLLALYLHPMEDITEEKKQELMVKASEAVIEVSQAANLIVAEELVDSITDKLREKGENNAKES